MERQFVYTADLTTFEVLYSEAPPQFYKNPIVTIYKNPNHPTDEAIEALRFLADELENKLKTAI